MKWLNCEKIRLVLVGFVAGIIVGGGSAKADFTFGEPVNLGPMINSPEWEYSHCVSADNLELYFGSYRDGGYGASDIWVSTRETTEDEWGPAENLGPPVNTDDEDLGVCLSADGLELYFQSWRPGGLGGGDIWVTRRTARGEPWGEPVNLGAPINSEIDEYNPCLSADGLELYFVFGLWEPEGGPTEVTIGVARRETKDDPWGERVSLGPIVNSCPCQDTPWISSDGRVLVFTDVWVCEPRPGGCGATDIWLTRRAGKDAEWSEPVNLGPPINTEFEEDLSMISADGSMLYFNSNRPGGSGEGDLWQASIIPIVDFNGDGNIDTEDLLIMIDNWGANETLCDIGPMPWGDGIVDEADLEVLMSYWGKEIDDLTLIAHWKLDETEGTIAYDSAGEHDGTMVGLDPATAWIADGAIGGAVDFDGIDGHNIAILDSAELDFGDDDFSISLMVRYHYVPTKEHRLVSKGTFGAPGTGSRYDLFIKYSKLRFEIDNGPANVKSSLQVDNAQVMTGEWIHLVAVRDAANDLLELYADGVQLDSVAPDDIGKNGTDISGDISNGEGMRIGATTDDVSTMMGDIDDVRIFNSALTEDQIGAIY